MPLKPPDGSNTLAQALSAGLGGIIERACLLDALDQQLRQALPTNLANQCKLANVDADRLVMLVNSPTWKTRLRMHSNELLVTARALGLPVRDLTIKVATARPASQQRAELPPPASPLSPEARRHLDEAASVVDNPELRAILQHLASLPDPD